MGDNDKDRNEHLLGFQHKMRTSQILVRLAQKNNQTVKTLGN